MDFSYGPDPDLSDSDDSLCMNYKPIRKQPELSKEQEQRAELDYFYAVIASNSVEGLLELLNKGHSVNTDIRDGWTPLLLSCSFGHFEVVTILLENGADVNQARNLMTPLMCACNCLNYSDESCIVLDIVKLLIEKGADVKAINRQRKNALMFAAETGNLNVVQHILPLSDKEAIDNQGWNVLSWAISHNHIDIVKYLMTQNFSLDIIDIREQSLYDIARGNGFKKILDLLPKPESEITVEDFYCNTSFEKEFQVAKNQQPIILNEICNILYSINCQHLLPIFKENNVNLDDFLCLTDEELEQLGIKLPIHRYKIIEALYSFHLRPFSSKSLRICLNKEDFSNTDAAIQLTSAVYQITAMNSSIKFILKNLQDLNDEEKRKILDAIEPIKQLMQIYKHLSNQLNERIDEWDKLAKAPDLITKDSIRSRYPWTKIAISCGLLGGLILLIRPKYIFSN